VGSQPRRARWLPSGKVSAGGTYQRFAFVKEIS
jgi:hypothetical protein